MEEVLSELLTTIRSSRIAPDQINLPPFRPDVDDATSWLQQADATKVEFSWSDLQILGRIGSFLTGESKLWFDNWVPPPTTRNWTTFKQDFLESFPPKKILGRLLHEASACRSSDFNTYTAYVRQKVTLLRHLRKIIDELLSHGIIRTSTSPFASPILLVKKKQGSYRMCVDFRELNAHTVKDKYPMPRIDDQLDRLGRGKFFTSLDLASGFHQIPIHDNSIHKTGFVTPEGHFEYLRMPFGLANAPAVFQRAINAALGDLKYTMALVYMDDILILQT
ncbi:hypothetical protein Zmor_024178 [Zophobas morio]|uniref:Reverse transcriptase domain-containing protein n=1 Tax=Zophobas morio TaxID=2755281 RepID=A0AA38M8K1_9CUCU|nr:hypothetical protein Zmor_024178 [Zophobas morio]